MGNNRIFIDRTQGVGLLTQAEATDRSCTGPVVRASGVTRDLRRDEPYLAYSRFRFPVSAPPRATAAPDIGAYGRDARKPQDYPPGAGQSARGAGQYGPGAAVILPAKRSSFRPSKGLITHFELVMTNRGIRCPARKSIRPRRLRTGNWASTWLATARRGPMRIRCRPPSFIHFAVFPYLIRGHTLSDVVAVLGSLNIIAAELDR